MIWPTLYVITDRRSGGERTVPETVQAAIEGGLRLVQYREKELPKREGFEVARALRDLTRSAKATLIINDDLDLALAVAADGIHLGQEDLPLPVARKILGPEKIIGISVRDMEMAKEALQCGADYLAVGPLFKSRTKQVRPPMGCGIIRQIRALTDIPLYGIGGVDLTNACSVLEAGADGVAVISAIHQTKNIREATREFIHLLGRCNNPSN